MTVKHATFSLERTYPASTAAVFAAWADPAAKARWFAGPDAEHELDFRVGGVEVNRSRHENGSLLTFESHYRDIVEGERIVYTSTLSADQRLATVSLTTVQFSPDDDGGTRLLLVEQDTFLDDLEEPEWREQGTSSWLDALDGELKLRAGS